MRGCGRCRDALGKIRGQQNIGHIQLASRPFVDVLSVTPFALKWQSCVVAAMDAKPKYLPFGFLQEKCADPWISKKKFSE